MQALLAEHASAASLLARVKMRLNAERRYRVARAMEVRENVVASLCAFLAHGLGRPVKPADLNDILAGLRA